MKCNLHPQVDAVGVCIRCGKGLCKECEIELAGKLYCKVCANDVFKKLNTIDNEVSGWYYILPVFFGMLGGIIAFFINDNFKKNKNRAKNMLGLGIIISILWFLPLLLPLCFLAL